MTSDRGQRRIERLLDQIDEAEAAGEWSLVSTLAHDVLDLAEDHPEALAYLRAAERRLRGGEGLDNATIDNTAGAMQSQTSSEPQASVSSEQPTSFSNGRYEVTKFLGEGGKKKVYLAHDTMLDREVAFALIKTEGLDEVGMTRVNREAQAMGRLGSHPHIVTVFDLGQQDGQPHGHRTHGRRRCGGSGRRLPGEPGPHGTGHGDIAGRLSWPRVRSLQEHSPPGPQTRQRVAHLRWDCQDR